MAANFQHLADRVRDVSEQAATLNQWSVALTAVAAALGVACALWATKNARLSMGQKALLLSVWLTLTVAATLALYAKAALHSHADRLEAKHDRQCASLEKRIARSGDAAALVRGLELGCSHGGLAGALMESGACVSRESRKALAERSLRGEGEHSKPPACLEVPVPAEKPDGAR